MKAIRTTISFPPEQLQRLQEMADQHGLSLAGIYLHAVTASVELGNTSTWNACTVTHEKDQG